MIHFYILQPLRNTQKTQFYRIFMLWSLKIFKEGYAYIFFIILKKINMHEKGPGNTHPALCSTFL
jgi:hypothetical protein